MSTDEERSKLDKLLQGLEVADVKLTERCSDLVKEFKKKYQKVVDDEEEECVMEVTLNPYKVDKGLLQENQKKLDELLSETKRIKKEFRESVILTDPKRPWRMHSNKEKLLRINNEIKRHYEKASQVVTALPEKEIKNLIKECEEENGTASTVGTEKLRSTVDEAKKNLPNFQYRKIENSTATEILARAHETCNKNITPEHEVSAAD